MCVCVCVCVCLCMYVCMYVCFDQHNVSSSRKENKQFYKFDSLGRPIIPHCRAKINTLIHTYTYALYIHGEVSMYLSVYLFQVKSLGI